MQDFVPMLWQAFCGLLGLLIMVLAWLGKRIHGKLDQICATLVDLKDTASERHADHEARIVRLETKIEMTHDH